VRVNNLCSRKAC